MKTIKLLLMAWSHWLLVDPRSEKFFNWVLIVATGLFFRKYDYPLFNTELMNTNKKQVNEEVLASLITDRRHFTYIQIALLYNTKCMPLGFESITAAFVSKRSKDKTWIPKGHKIKRFELIPTTLYATSIEGFG